MSALGGRSGSTGGGEAGKGTAAAGDGVGAGPAPGRRRTAKAKDRNLTPARLARTLLQGEGTEAQYLALRTELGLDQPVLLQFGRWLGRALQGDLGVSFLTKEPVVDLLNGRIGVTLSLMAGVLIVCVAAGLALGVLSGLRGGWAGRFIDTLSLGGLIFPSFWVALVFIAVFAVWLKWLPATGYTPFRQAPVAWLLGLVLPVMSVAMRPITTVAKQTRDSMKDVLGRDFIRSLRAAGLPERSVIWRHAVLHAADHRHQPAGGPELRLAEPEGEAAMAYQQMHQRSANHPAARPGRRLDAARSGPVGRLSQCGGAGLPLRLQPQHLQRDL